MKKGIILTGTILMLTAVAHAQNDSMTTTTTTTSDTSYRGDLYRANEFSLEGFAGLSLDKDTISHISTQRVSDHGHVGGGIGGNYFFTRCFGVGGEAYSESIDQHAIDSAAGHAIFRIPIGDTGLAPYGFLGGGHLFDPIQCSEGHAGAGLEFRFTRNIGIFTDARWVVSDRLGNFGMARLGMRFAF